MPRTDPVRPTWQGSSNLDVRPNSRWSAEYVIYVRDGFLDQDEVALRRLLGVESLPWVALEVGTAGRLEIDR